MSDVGGDPIESSESLQRAYKRVELENELTAVAARIVDTKAHEARLYDQRRSIFRQLKDLGVSQASMARTAGITDHAVALALEERDNDGGGDPEVVGT